MAAAGRNPNSIVAAPPESFRQRQYAVSLDLRHDRAAVVGRLVALEHDGAGLWATFTSSELQLLRNLTEAWYLSAEVGWRGTDADATDIQLRSVALVREPAATCIRPVEILIGALGSTLDRQRWRVDSATRDRLERAAEVLTHRRSPSDPVHVSDRTPERERLLRRRDWTPVEMAMALDDDQDDRRPPGPLRIRPSRIISVR